MKHVNVDIDGVLADNLDLFSRYIEKEYGEKVPVSCFDEYNCYIPQIGKNLDTVIEHMYKNNPDFLYTAKKMDGAFEAMDRLNSNFKVSIISHRNKKVQSITKDWLNLKGFNYDNLVIDPEVRKGNFNEGILIDDSPKVIERCVEDNNDFIVFPKIYNVKYFLKYNDSPLINKYNKKDLYNLLNENNEWDVLLKYID